MILSFVHVNANCPPLFRNPKLLLISSGLGVSELRLPDRPLDEVALLGQPTAAAATPTAAATAAEGSREARHGPRDAASKQGRRERAPVGSFYGRRAQQRPSYGPLWG